MLNLNKNIVANIFGQGWSALMSIIFAPLYIAILGIESYALIGIYVFLQASLKLLDLGLTPTITREISKYSSKIRSETYIRDLIRTIEGIFLGISLFTILIFYISSDYLSINWLLVEDLSYELVSEMIILISLIISVRFIEGIYRACLIGLQLQVWHSVAHAIFSTFMYGGAVLIIQYVHPSIKAFFIWQIIICFVSLIIFRVKLYSYLPDNTIKARFSILSLKEIYRFASGVFLISSFSVLLSQADKFFLSYNVSLEELGFYMLASSVAAVMVLTCLPITQAIYPKMVNYFEIKSTKELANIFHYGSQLITAIAAPIVIVFSFFSYEVLYLWSLDPVISSESGGILVILLLGSFLNASCYLPYHLQLSSGWTELALKANALSAALLIPFMYFIAPIHGSIGVAFAWLIFNMCYLLITVQVMFRKLLSKEKSSWYLEDILFPLLGAFIGPVLIKMFVTADLNNWLNYLFIILISFLVSYLGSFLMANEIRYKIINYLK